MVRNNMTTRSVAAGLLAAIGLLGIGMIGCEKKTEPAPSKPAASAPTTPAGNNAAAAPAAGASAAAAAAKPAAGGRDLVIGVIAKSQSNPVFIAARTGAEDAAKDLSAKHGIKITINWQTPVSEDAQKQAQYIEQLAGQNVDGISLSCTDGQVLQRPIDAAADKGIPVVTFDSDSPASKRMAYVGIDDVAGGRSVMQQLAKAMGDKGGPIAILGGSQTAPNLQARIKGVKEELEKLKDKGFTLKEVYYHKETANDAAAEIQRVQNANPDIKGWAMVGGWPLFTQNALTGISDKGVKVVGFDTLPEQLGYVSRGEVQSLIGQNCYGWGYESVRILVEKLHEKKDPAKVINTFDLAVVTKDNVAEYEGLWQKWLGKK
jgi:ribose transport system substrate-binding protein